MEIVTPLEARVLGVMIEKENLVPGNYPLTLRAVTAGCNQKTNRKPRIYVAQGEVMIALQSLFEKGYMTEHKAKRATRYAHSLASELRIPKQSVPLLGILLLRGPQKASEMRVHTGSMYNFPNVESIEGFMRALSRDRDEPLVAPLPRINGEREVRWAQQLTGPTKRAEKKEMTLDEIIEMMFDLQRRIRILEEDLLVRST